MAQGRKERMVISNVVDNVEKARETALALIGKQEDINYLEAFEYENIEDVENVEKSVLLKEDIVKMLKEGNQAALKKKLNELVKGKSEDLIRSIKDQIVKTATEVGVDSSAKRKVICEFAGLDYEMVGDVLFEVQ